MISLTEMSSLQRFSEIFQMILKNIVPGRIKLFEKHPHQVFHLMGKFKFRNVQAEYLQLNL